jgi:hypothetical protein
MFVRWIIEVGGLWHKSVRCEDDRLTLANSLHFHEKSSARFNRHVLDDATGQYRVHGSRLRVFQPSQNIARPCRKSHDPRRRPNSPGANRCLSKNDLGASTRQISGYLAHSQDRLTPGNPVAKRHTSRSVRSREVGERAAADRTTYQRSWTDFSIRTEASAPIPKVPNTKPTIAVNRTIVP